MLCSSYSLNTTFQTNTGLYIMYIIVCFFHVCVVFVYFVFVSELLCLCCVEILKHLPVHSLNALIIPILRHCLPNYFLYFFPSTSSWWLTPIPECLRSGLSWFNWRISFAPEFQCDYFCESSCLFHLSLNSDFYVSKIMHLWARNLPRKPNN